MIHNVPDRSQSCSLTNESQSHSVKKKCSELVFGDHLISEVDNALKGKPVSHLTFETYQSMDIEAKKLFK